MDVTQALKDAENGLRDFINFILQKKLGLNWEEKSGVTKERLEKWQERKLAEEKRQESGAVEQRLIYYADFYDLKTILKKNWEGPFSETFGNLNTLEVWLTELEKLRDPDAHRRELLPHQQALAIGISGEIRTRITRYRSKQETNESYFPRIESVSDNLGNTWTPNINAWFKTGRTLRPGEFLSFVITATDPQGNELKYGLSMPDNEFHWQDKNTFSFTVNSNYIGSDAIFELYVKSPRNYHAHHGFEDYDDMIKFIYDILPPLSTRSQNS